MTPPKLSVITSTSNGTANGQGFTMLQQNPLLDYEMPRLSPLAPNLVCASFFVMKLFPAKCIIEGALASGELKPGGEVIESTSGTFGLALALLSRHYDFKVTLVSDPVIDPLLKQRFEAMGVELQIVDSKGEGGYQVARMERVQQLMAERPGAYFTNQYYNPNNARGYQPCTEYLLDRLGHIDYLVGPVGTGGSMSGIGGGLMERLPNLKIVGVDTHRSVVFGQRDGKRALRGLGNSLIPGNVNHTLFDQVHWVSAAEAYNATRKLHKRHGLYMGGTSGAAYLVADWVARTHPDKRVLTLFPDDGYRYQDTIYNDKFVKKLPNWKKALPLGPVMLSEPDATVDHWACYEWRRRSRKEVVE